MQVILCAVADGLDRALHAALGGPDDHGCVGGKDPIAEQVNTRPSGRLTSSSAKSNSESDHPSRLVDGVGNGNVCLVLLEHGRHLFLSSSSSSSTSTLASPGLAPSHPNVVELGQGDRKYRLASRKFLSPAWLSDGCLPMFKAMNRKWITVCLLGC